MAEEENEFDIPKWIIFVWIILLILPLVFYFSKFYSSTLSSNNDDWAKFGEYLNGTFMPLIALSGVLVTLILGYISENRNKTNIAIEKLKSRPFVHITYSDYENDLEVRMINKGAGPLVISKYQLIKSDGTPYSGFFEILPSIIDMYTNYTGNMTGSVLRPNEERELFRFTQQPNDRNYISDREKIRNVLKNFKIAVEYKDVYGTSMPKYEQSLTWFGRKDGIKK